VPVLPPSHPAVSTDGGGGGGERGYAVYVPKGYVWVEGDNPLYSIDSRHYGPLPLSNVRGRVVYRMWPMRRNRGVGVQPHLNGEDEGNKVGDSGGGDSPEDRINSCFVSSVRPQPIVLRQGEVYGGDRK